MEEEQKEENKEIFMDGIDEDNVTMEIQRHLNAIFSYSSHLIHFKYYLLIYRIIKKNYMTVKQLTEVTGLNGPRIYTIVNEFEKRETKRQGLT